MRYTLSTIGLAMVLLAGFLIVGFQDVDASAPAGASATVATSSAITMPAVTVISIAATSSCAATIVQTGASALMLQFSDRKGSTLTGQNGTALQAASSTEVYDSGQYGCGRIRAYSYVAQPITITQTN